MILVISNLLLEPVFRIWCVGLFLVLHRRSMYFYRCIFNMQFSTFRMHAWNVLNTRVFLQTQMNAEPRLVFVSLKCVFFCQFKDDESRQFRIKAKPGVFQGLWGKMYLNRSPTTTRVSTAHCLYIVLFVNIVFF